MKDDPNVIAPCRDFEESLETLRRDGFLYLHVSPLLPSIAEEQKSEWWVQMIEDRLAVNTKLVAAKTTLVSPDVFRLWTTALGGSVASRAESEMMAGLLDRDIHQLLGSMTGKRPAGTRQVRARSGLDSRRFAKAMDALEARGWVVAAGQDRSRTGSMISLLWTTADDWWGASQPRPSAQDRILAWQEFIDQLAAACRTDPSRAERLLSWSPVADLRESGITLL